MADDSGPSLGALLEASAKVHRKGVVVVLFSDRITIGVLAAGASASTVSRMVYFLCLKREVLFFVEARRGDFGTSDMNDFFFFLVWFWF